MIGFYDRDFIEEYPDCKYNIQAMKLARFYARKNIAYEMFTDISQAGSYEKVYYFQDGDYEYPKECLLPNVEVRGYSFGDKYVPLPPEVEKSLPDPLIYRRIFSRKGLTEKQIAHLERMDGGYHIQCFDTGVPFEEVEILDFCPARYKKIFLHDKIVDGYFDFQQIFKKIKTIDGRQVAPKNISVVLVYDTMFNNVDTYLSLGQIKISEYSKTMHFPGTLSLSDYAKVLRTLHIPQNSLTTFFHYEPVDNFYDEQKMYVNMTKKILISKEIDFPVNFIYDGVEEELESPEMLAVMIRWTHRLPRRAKDTSLRKMFQLRNGPDFKEAYEKFPELTKYLDIQKATFYRDGGIWRI